ncbi:MAG TPA: PP2C family protein-serine/threonine phosphatase [Thermoanaerobaculia bacterium]|nr:PP2C family protein-serine/threonine phosphatase [Thermoanaerobaculia bacterium]
MMTSRPLPLRLPVVLLLGALVLAAGLALAWLWMPEWQGAPVPDEARFVTRYRELARRAGITLEPGAPQVQLKTESGNLLSENDRKLDSVSPELSLRRVGRGVRITLAQEGTLGDDRKLQELIIDLSPSGYPRSVRWMPRGLEKLLLPEPTPDSTGRAKLLLGLLLSPGESAGELQSAFIANVPGYLVEIRGSNPPEHAQVMIRGGRVELSRHLGSLEEGRARLQELGFTQFLWHYAPPFLRVLAVLGLFVVLVSKGRIDLVNGAILAAATFLASFLPGLWGDPTVGVVAFSFFVACVQAFWVFVIWSAGESFLRAADPSFTTSLDSLRAGRLGPRGGRSLLYGLSLGAALAGFELAIQAAATAMPGMWPEAFSIRLPVFDVISSPFGLGISLAGAIIVVIAVVRRIVPKRWALAAAVLVGALLLGPLRIHPLPLELAGNLIVIGLLVVFGRWFGLTTLLTASVTSFLLPAAAFSAWNPGWLPVTLGVTAGTSAALLALGFVGLRRPEQVEMERLKPPPFIRRLEEERRIKYEMDLLARMQLGLLPTRLPEVEGWEIAARSLLATEAGGDLYDFIEDDAGRLWIAAGDVAGHGYSCAIVHAMTTAALASLISSESTPAEVLRQVDRVLRRASLRNFASLVLLLLDTKTGKALLSNAGHPYPLALSNGEVSEIEISGLPLGQGPARVYEDVTIQIPPGGALVFCSDGLFEAVDWSSSPYGFERPQEVLRTLEDRSADEIVEALLHDWQKHLRSEEPPDDTTVVVVKRARG